MAIGVLQLHDESEPVKPKVIDSFSVSNGLSSIASGFGAVWAADPIKGQVLRIDPETHRVTKRIAVGGEVQVAVGAGAVWALGGDLLTSGALGAVDLVRIDPRTNEVVVRIPMLSPGGENFSPLSVAVVAARLGHRRRGGVAHRPRSQSGRPLRELPRAARRRGGPRRARLGPLPDGRLRELDARTGRTTAEVQLRNTATPTSRRGARAR